MQDNMARGGLIVHAVAGLALLGLVASWLVLLGGISAVQKECGSNCRVITGLPWWILWFQFLVIILLAATQVSTVCSGCCSDRKRHSSAWKKLYGDAGVVICMGKHGVSALQAVCCLFGCGCARCQCMCPECMSGLKLYLRLHLPVKRQGPSKGKLNCPGK